jgi:hypothetical protein
MTGRAVLISAAAAWSTWGRSRRLRHPLLSANSEQEARQPLLHLQLPTKNSPLSSRQYGVADGPQFTDAPERTRAELGSVPEEDPEGCGSLSEEEEDFELGLEGLYRGASSRLAFN